MSKRNLKARIEAKKRARALVIYSPQLPSKIAIENSDDAAHIPADATDAAEENMALNLQAIDEYPQLKLAAKPVAKLHEETALKPLTPNAIRVDASRERGWNYPLAACGLALFAISVAMMVRNAWGPNWAGVAPWVALGIVAEGIQLFGWPWLPMVSWPKRLAGAGLIAACLCFAVWNTFNIASITAEDQEQARTYAIVERLAAACPPAATTVTKKGKTSTTVTVGAAAGCEVAKTALPKAVGRDFAAAVSWVTAGAVRLSTDDFSMLGLLLRTLLPQLGGVALFVARR